MECHQIMSEAKYSNLKELIFWSYANLAMAHAGIDKQHLKYGTFHYIIRAKLFKGLKDGTMNIRSIFADEKVKVSSIQDIVEYNKKDIEKRAPYGQNQFELILSDTTSDEAFKTLQNDLKERGLNYFKPAWDAGAIVMVGLNNFQAAQAAVAHAPCLAVPLGYKPDGQPAGLTFIGPSNSESILYIVAHAFEKAHPVRKMPQE